MDDKKYWLGLSLVPELGPVRLSQLVSHFGSVEEAWTAPENQLRQSGLHDRAITQLLQSRRKLNLNEEMDKVDKAGAWILTKDDTLYPTALREIADAPFILYVRGSIEDTDNLSIALVGTRNATKYGRDVALTLGKELAQAGVTVVSGLAVGVDTQAHKGALAAKGRTIAVLGCGVDIIYPRENTSLAQSVMAHGAIISEYPIGTQPHPTHFPRRNRIISGLSTGVVVVEAPETSGALITAREALDQGRDVFAVPANIFNPMGRGSNRLIQDGAKLVGDVHDILEELQVVQQQAETQRQTETISPASEQEKAILNILEADPIHIDDVIRLSGLSTDVVTSTLTLLELKGMVQMTGSKSYSRMYR